MNVIIEFFAIMMVLAIIVVLSFIIIEEAEQHITYPCKGYFCNISNINLDEKYDLCCVVDNYGFGNYMEMYWRRWDEHSKTNCEEKVEI